MKQLLARYLADFNLEYLATPPDRCRTRRQIVKALATAALIFTTAFLILYAFNS